jgi:hypothetical protein
MAYRQFVLRLMSDATDKLSALLGVDAGSTHWLTMTDRKSRGLHSETVTLFQVDGRTYLIDILVSKGKGWSRHMRLPGKGTLTTGRTDTDVTITEVTDPAVKHQVVIAFAAEKPKWVFASGEDKNLEPGSILVTLLRHAPDDTPEGLAAAVPHVAVFEVTPPQPLLAR